MDHSRGINIAVERASRARLIRFISFCNPDRRCFHNGRRISFAEWVSDASNAELVAHAYCFATHFWNVRKANEYRRRQNERYLYRPNSGPANHFTCPRYEGAAINEWLAQTNLNLPADRAPLFGGYQQAAE